MDLRKVKGGVLQVDFSEVGGAPRPRAVRWTGVADDCWLLNVRPRALQKDMWAWKVKIVIASWPV